jgi:hypothetical protein
LRKWAVYRNPNILPQKAENGGLPESGVILEQKTPPFGGILWVILFKRCGYNIRDYERRGRDSNPRGSLLDPLLDFESSAFDRTQPPLRFGC